MKQQKITSSLFTILIVICVVYAGYQILRDNTVQRTDDAYVRADSVMISARVSGQIVKVLITDNQEVKQGQLLAELDECDYQAAQSAALANVAVGQAEVQNLLASIRRQGAIIDQTIHSTAVSRKLVETNAERYLNLDILKAQLEIAKGTVARHQAELVQTTLNLSRTKIFASQDGVVGQRTLRIGAYVAPGQALLAIVPVHSAFVVANFRETQLHSLNIGQPVEMQIDSFPGRTFKGHIDSIAPATGLSFAEITPDNATGNFTKVAQRVPVKIVFDDSQLDLGRLRIGMSVIVSVYTGEVN